MKSRQFIAAAAMAMLMAPAAAFRAVQDQMGKLARGIDIRPPRVRNRSSGGIRASRRRIAQDKRDAAKRRNRLRAKWQFRKAVR